MLIGHGRWAARGDCFDSTVAESLLRDPQEGTHPPPRQPTKLELRTEVFDYVEVFRNGERRRSTLGQSGGLFENSKL